MTNTAIQSARTAICTPVIAAGLKCYEYESMDVPTQLAGELALDDFDCSIAPDQRIIYTRLAFTLRVYQPMSGNMNAALAYLDASMALVLVALGADVTLGGKVTNTSVGGGDIGYERYASGAMAALASFRVEVYPFAAGQ